MLPAIGTMGEASQEKAETIMALNQTELIKILKNPEAAEFARAKACQRLAVIGTKEAVPALSALLSDAKFAHYARFGLEPIPDSSVDEALRNALEQLKGRLRIGVINSLGRRKDAGAVGALAKLIDDDDAEIAAAAAAALGRIASLEAANELEKAVDYTKRVAGACLECAEGLLAQGKQEQARALYNALLRRSDLPSAVRTAATRGLESSAPR